MRKTLSYLVIILIILPFITTSMLMTAPIISGLATHQNILIVHSYSQGFTWTDELHKGITEQLDDNQFTVYTEYLDAYRQPEINENKIEFLKTYLDKNLMCIVVTDNPAYETMMALRADYFPDIPILFAGLNGYSKEDLPSPLVTGIAQNNSFDNFFSWLNIQMPEIKNIVVCGSNTATTRGVLEQIQTYMAYSNLEIKVTLVDDATYEAQIDRLNQFDKTNTILYVAGAFGVLNHDQYTQMLSTNSNLPTFCGVKTSIVGNVIGGFVVDPFEHGKVLNGYILKLASGTSVAQLPFIEIPMEKAIFNYPGLKTHQLLKIALPENAEVINGPSSVITLNKFTLVVLIAVFTILTFFIIALLIILVMNKRSRRKLESLNIELVGSKMELEAFSEELIASQAELTNQYDRVVETTSQIQQMVDFDKITGLYNDEQFYVKLEQRMQRQKPFAFLYIAIANLDALTFTHGKPIYEMVLQEVSRFLKHTFSQQDLIGITSNKHFLVVTDLDVSEKGVLLEELNRFFTTPLRTGIFILILDHKIGIAQYPKNAQTTDELIAFGRVAITPILKDSIRNYSYYEESIQTQFLLETRIRNEIEMALDHNQFMLYFQPKYALDGITLTGLEALMRWNYPDGTLKSPYYFIDIAEQSGQIIKMGYWVIEEVCKTIVAYELQAKNIIVALNLSGQHFANREIVDVLDSAILRYGISPRFIELEITETSLILNKEFGALILDELRVKGFKIALDDFGTGYASIAYIKDFPIDRIKVDQTFTKKIQDPKFEALLKAIIQLAQEMSFEVTVEGVETQEQYEIVKKYQPQELQGYLFSRPIPIERVAFE